MELVAPSISPRHTQSLQEKRALMTSVADAWKALLDTAEAMAPDYDPETRVSLNKFVDQLPSVKFNTDETDLLEENLRPRVEAIDGTLDIVSLSGNHITPCIQVKFNTDANDETDLLEENLRPRVEAFGSACDFLK
ncbi:alpha/beta hydrolase fold protein [Tanacetum coccineum]|uniref:Alpha/beta hydrolase fold protein n=1 Tax=Tanacetum coccineum TaxID=301880 RepID=A0ABQ5BC50_9ASTR